jgi:4-amino-4-deoxy-L-arabinose transferase-like glycosyltransferase
MRIAFPSRAALVLALALLTIASLVARAPLPVDETRYLAVAWEMWHRGEFLLPMLNGQCYGHKPPLLFWLIHAGWMVFGVNDWWPRLIGPLATLACLVLIRRLAQALWPFLPRVAQIAPWILLGTWCIALFSTTIMFDMILLATVLGAHLATLRAIATRAGVRPWALFALCVAAGLMTKGPVALVYTLPVALSAPWWVRDGAPLRWQPWLSRALIATLIASLPVIVWVALVATQADAVFVRHMLVDQTLHRISGTMGHGRPIWWYLPWLAVVALPWLAWPTAWRAIRALARGDAGNSERFLAVSAASAFAVLSLIGGKQVHYLFPIVALGALALARGLDAAEASSSLAPPRMNVDARQFAIASLAFVLLLLAVVMPRVAERYNLTPAARYAGVQQRSARPLAYLGHYQGEFTFAGRLVEPVQKLGARDVPAWLASHPDGLLIARRKRLVFRQPPRAEFSQPYKTDSLWMFGVAELRRQQIGFRDD